MLYIGLYRENMKKSSWPRLLIFGIKHHLVDHKGQKWPRPRGHTFYIGLYSENVKKKYSCLKSKGLEPCYIVCGIT